MSNCESVVILYILICIITHAGILSFTKMSAGETTIAWYLVSAASVAILLLPFVATPLTWVAVELLIQQARDSASERIFDEEMTDVGLQSRGGRDVPASNNVSVSDSCGRIQSAEHMAEEDHPNSRSAASTVITNEGTNLSAKRNGNNSETAINETDSAVAKEKSTTEVIKKEGQFLEVELYNVQSDSIDHNKFQSLNIPACAMMCTGLMCSSLSFMCSKLPLHALHE